MSRRVRFATAALLCLSLLAAGCQGDDGPEPTPSTPPPPSARWKPGEIKSAPADLCGALSQENLRGLGFTRTPATPSGDGCRLSQIEDDVNLDVGLAYKLYSPPPPRPDKSATDEARHEFQRPPGWRYEDATPLPGLGDEAKIHRGSSTVGWGRSTAVAIRVRNMIIQVDMSAYARAKEGRGRLPTPQQVENGVLTAAREAVRRLG